MEQTILDEKINFFTNAATLVIYDPATIKERIHDRVFNTPRTASGLALKSDSSWPSSYSGFEVVLEDMSLVEWRDRVLIEITRLDEENKIIYAELIDKFPREC